MLQRLAEGCALASVRRPDALSADPRRAHDVSAARMVADHCPSSPEHGASFSSRHGGCQLARLLGGHAVVEASLIKA